VVIYESYVIDEYLDERYPQPQLMPTDPVHRARVRLFRDFCDAELGPAVYALVKQVRNPSGGRDEEAVRQARTAIAGLLQRLDPELGDHEFLLGGFGLADIEIAPWVVGLDALGFKRDELPPRVSAWIDRLRYRPSVAAQIAYRNQGAST
jgi:RNA polymerase-associated protein